MWVPEFPLMQYCDSVFKKDSAVIEYRTWASMGPFYGSYGLYIIKKYPLHFLRYFVWPNTKKDFGPPIEYLGYYNGGRTTVLEEAAEWFGYKDIHVKTRVKSGQASTLLLYPILISISNLLLFLGLLSYLLLKGWQHNPSFNKGILLAGFVWIANAAFTIFAASAALRYQSFSALLSVIFSLLLIDWMTQLMQHMKRQNQQQSLAI
jgi:hypothetical protein